MTRPLLVDILAFLLPLCVGAAAFVVGRALHRWNKAIRVGVLSISFAAIAVAVGSLVGLSTIAANHILTQLGGPTVLLSWVALLLLGVVWSVPRRRFSSGFLATVAGLAGWLVVMETGGPLWWRFCAPELWQREADAQGCLQQSSGLTCSPAAAVMLLHRYGISASEGEMAYLAGTSLFGTDAYSMARALDNKLGPHGLHARLLFTNYDACVSEGSPFLAHVQGPYLGHALFVERVSSERVSVLDPLDGMSRTLSRREFEVEWDGTAIQVVGP